MNRLETIKAAIEWARKNPKAYAEFVERRKREAEEDAAIEAEARAEEWREMQEAKEAADRAASGPSISIRSEAEGAGGGATGGQANQPPTPPPPAESTAAEPPQEGEKKPVESGADAGVVNDAPKPPDAAGGAESRSDGNGSENEGESSMWTYTDEEGNKQTIPAPEIEEVDGEVEVVPFPD